MVLRVLLISAVCAPVVLYAGPELFRDRVFPFDEVLYVSNGAFFLSLFQDVSGFAAGPSAWMYDYYNHYPALNVRRYPPLFGLAEAGVYAVTGVSVFGARLTNLAFFLAFAAGTYCCCRRLWKDDLVAFAATLLAVTTPVALALMRSLWLDVPALAFATWAIYFYAARLEEGRPGWRPTLLMALFMALSLYTYQLTVFLLAGVVLHLFARERWGVLRDRKLLITAGLFLAAMVPLTVFTVYMGRDNLRATAGGVEEDWAVFAPVRDKADLRYWTYYLNVLAAHYPVQTAGLVLWAVLRARKASAAEAMFLACFCVGYLAFSWVPSKVPRYAFHFAFAACPLTALAGRELVALLARRRTVLCRVGLGCLAVGAAGAQALWGEPAPCAYVSDMHRPARAVLAANPSARVLYSGPMDAAFVFYVRQADPGRSATVYRAGVQLQRPEDLAAFVARENIDFLVYEDASHVPGGPLHARFRGAITAFLGDDGAAAREEFRLPFGLPGKEQPVTLHVVRVGAAE